MSRAPGSLISKQDIVKSFGVSPSPVRDALLRLQSEGLVDIVPQTKTPVSLIDVQKARVLHFLRLSVEIEVVRRLSKSISPSQLAELEVWIRRLSVGFKAGNTTACRLSDTTFHERLYAFAGVPGVVDIIQAHRGH